MLIELRDFIIWGKLNYICEGNQYYLYLTFLLKAEKSLKLKHGCCAITEYSKIRVNKLNILSYAILI